MIIKQVVAFLLKIANSRFIRRAIYRLIVSVKSLIAPVFYLIDVTKPLDLEVEPIPAYISEGVKIYYVGISVPDSLDQTVVLERIAIFFQVNEEITVSYKDNSYIYNLCSGFKESRSDEIVQEKLRDFVAGFRLIFALFYVFRKKQTKGSRSRIIGRSNYLFLKKAAIQDLQQARNSWETKSEANRLRARPRTPIANIQSPVKLSKR